MLAAMPGDADYERLFAFRTELRRFVRWSEDAAHDAGLTPALHQLLLAVRGGGSDDAGPTIGSTAEALLVKHHTAVELAQRAEAAGLLKRMRDDSDHRMVHLRLTPTGEKRLAELSDRHLEAIQPLAKRLTDLAS
jgi:DNA-binding MarR family transcriptional regulator